MEKFLYKFNLDVTKGEAQKCLTGFRIGESAARRLLITLTNGKNPIYLDGESETVEMFVMKPSDTTPSVNACTVEGNTIIYDVLQSDVSEAGVTTFTLKIAFVGDNNTTGIAYAAVFEAQVEDPECDDSQAPSDPTYTLLEQLVEEVNEIRSQIVTYDGEAEKWAVGTKDGVPVDPTDPTFHNNAKFWSEGAQAITQEDIEKAEAWANGTKGGVPVSSDDPAYHANSKYWSEIATTAGTTASAAATTASSAATTATTKAGEASTSATTASTAASTATTKAGEAATSASTASTAATTATTKAGEATSAASTATTKASEAAASATAAAASAQTSGDAEAYAVGTRNSQPVGTSDPAYHNNAKYWAEQASGATAGVTSFNGRSGLVVPAANDYAIEQIAPTAGATEGQVPMVNSSGELEMSDLPATVQSDWNQSTSTAPDYIKNKPTIPAAQIQSDWNQSDTTAKDFIKNKPTIPAAQVNADWNANSGVAQILNKPTIPDAQIQSDWNQTTTTAKDYIKNKPTIPTVPSTYAASAITAGTLAGQVKANATAVQTLGTAQVRNIYFGTSALTSSDTLAEGDLYFQYEVVT